MRYGCRIVTKEDGAGLASLPDLLPEFEPRSVFRGTLQGLWDALEATRVYYEGQGKTVTGYAIKPVQDRFSKHPVWEAVLETEWKAVQHT